MPECVIIIMNIIWAPSSKFVSSSIPSWQILTAHAQPFRGARDLAFCLKVPLDSLLVWASSGGSGENLAWTFTARVGDKYQIHLTRPIWVYNVYFMNQVCKNVFSCTYMLKCSAVITGFKGKTWIVWDWDWALVDVEFCLIKLFFKFRKQCMNMYKYIIL